MHFLRFFYFVRKFILKKKLILIFLLIFSFCTFAENFKKIYVDLPIGQTTLRSTFFCFNDLETGKTLAFELFGIKDLESVLKDGGFKKLMLCPVGSEIAFYNYAIMIYEKEFWFFENRDDGFLWGTGRYKKGE